MKMIHTIIIILVITLSLTAKTHFTSGEDLNNIGSSLKPSYFRPTPKQVDKVLKYSLLADWDYYIENHPLKISSIELQGFEDFNNGKKMNFKTSKPEILDKFQSGLHPNLMTRPAISDFSKFTFTVGCDYDLTGTILINTPDKQIVLGISCYGFQLDDVAPNKLTHFHSWLLAKTVNDVITSETGKQLDKNTFDALSGIESINHQKKEYDRISNSNAVK